MAKAGMKRYVSNHKDPTYDQALGNIRKQERAAAFTAMLKVRRMLEAAGYVLWCDLKIRSDRSGEVYVSKSEYVGVRFKHSSGSLNHGRHIVKNDLVIEKVRAGNKYILHKVKDGGR